MVNSSLLSSPANHKVSVVMPAYCGQRYIAQSIRSVLEQSYAELELIVVDDGSTDGTASIVQALGAEDGRVVYVHQQNAGQGNARNTGVRRASGDLVGFLDQDDLWERRKLELQIRAMDATGADVVFSNGFIFSEEDAADESTTFAHWFAPLAGKFDGPSMFRLLFELNRIPVLSALVRRDALQKIGLLEGDLQYQNCDDYDLWLRLAETGATFYGMEERLVRYRLHGAQASLSRIRMLKSEIAVLERHRSSPLVSAAAKEARLCALYRTLVEALLDEHRSDEAQHILKELARRERTVPFTFFERMLIRTLPGQYTNVCRHLDRAQASFSYRLARPVKSLYRKPAA